MKTPIAEVRHVAKAYRTDTVETLALSDVSLAVHGGDFLAITGPSGCGKSTMLNLLGLLDAPDSGTVHFAQQDVSKMDYDERARLRNETIGIVFQSFNLIPELSVLDNVLLPSRFARTLGPRVARAHELLERVGLVARKQHFPHQLSGGQQQRVAIARALLMAPQLLLLDEPTGNLDSASSAQILDLIESLHSPERAIVLVTHDPQCAARARRQIHMQDGRVLAQDGAAASVAV
jgi:putative ABC transport system ATP-binding protein